MKANFFFIWAAFGFYFPYFNVYYQETGLSGTQIGAINTLAPLLSGISSIAIGMLNDRYGHTRLLFGAACLGGIGTAIAIGQNQNFLWILIFAGLLSFFANPLPPLLDSTLIRRLGPDAYTYGRFRVWGTIGFILTSALGAQLIHRFGLPVVFPAFALALAIFLVSSQRIPDTPLQSEAVSPFKGLAQMMRQSAWLLFAAGVFLIWISVTGFNVFHGVTIKLLGGDENLVSLSSMAAAGAEIPIMLASAPLLKRFGARRFVQVAFVGYVIRMSAYALMPTPQWAPVISLLQIISFGPFWLGAVAYADELAPASLKATSQGLLATVMSLANMVGAIIGGRILDLSGVSGLYWGLAAFAVAAVFLLWIGRGYSKEESPGAVPVEK